MPKSRPPRCSKSKPRNSSKAQTAAAKAVLLENRSARARGQLKPIVDYDQARLRHALETDLTLPVQLVIDSPYFRPRNSTDQPLLEEMVTQLELDGFALVTRLVNLTKGTRTKKPITFVCKSAGVARLAGWNLRQLSGCAGIRHGLNISPSDWNLRALERTNIPDLAIPDAELHLPHLLPAARFAQGIALEWDSGSATRSTLLEKAMAYSQVSQCQLWAAGSIDRAETLLEILRRVLPREHCGVVAVDWRVGTLLGWVLPHTPSPICSSLERLMPKKPRWDITL